MALVAVIVRLLLSVIFFRAALHKFNDLAQFRSELAAYQLLPSPLLTAAVFFLVSSEIITALLLLVLSSYAGLLFSALLLFLYASAMAINVLKGRTSIDCGCSTSLAARKSISWSLVLRNALLAALALLAMTAPALALTITNSVLALAATACTLFLYEAAEQAFANSQRYRHWLAKQPVKL